MDQIIRLNQPQLQMRQFNTSEYRPVQTDMGLLQESLRQYEARQERASENRKQLDVALANIQSKLHNDDETNAWFKNYKDNIMAKIDNQIQSDNYGLAVREAMEQAGKVLQDEPIQGRIKAQEAWLEEDKLQQGRRDKGEISDSTYEWWKAKYGQYKYKDIHQDNDPTKPIIGGTAWETDKRPVKDIDVNNVAYTAYKLATPEKTDETTGYQNRFEDYKADGRNAYYNVDKDGNKTYVDIPDGSTVTIGGGRNRRDTREWVDVKRIRENLENALKGSGDGLRSAEQAFEVAKFQYKKLQDEILSLQQSFNNNPSSKELQEEIKMKKDQLQKRGELLYANNGEFTDYMTYYSRVICDNLLTKNLAYDWRTSSDVRQNTRDLGIPSGGSGGGNTKNNVIADGIVEQGASVEGTPKSGDDKLSDDAMNYDMTD